MEKEEIPEIKQESQLEKSNPNTIGEVLSIGKDLPTFPDKVYRSVMGREAIDDIENSGIVRNKQSAGLVEKSRWGERVFWSKGSEGKYHNVQSGGYVIEAPLSVAEERVVTKEDITAIYTKNENNSVFDILKQNREIEETQKQEVIEKRKKDNEQKLADVRKSLGIGE